MRTSAEKAAQAPDTHDTQRRPRPAKSSDVCDGLPAPEPRQHRESNPCVVHIREGYARCRHPLRGHGRFHLPIPVVSAAEGDRSTVTRVQWQEEKSEMASTFDSSLLVAFERAPQLVRLPAHRKPSQPFLNGRP